LAFITFAEENIEKQQQIRRSGNRIGLLIKCKQATNAANAGRKSAVLENKSTGKILEHYEP